MEHIAQRTVNSRLSAANRRPRAPPSAPPAFFRQQFGDDGALLTITVSTRGANGAAPRFALQCRAPAFSQPGSHLPVRSPRAHGALYFHVPIGQCLKEGIQRPCGRASSAARNNRAQLAASMTGSALPVEPAGRAGAGPRLRGRGTSEAALRPAARHAHGSGCAAG